MSKVCYRASDKSMFAYHDSVAARADMEVMEYDEAISLIYGAQVVAEVPKPRKRGRPRKTQVVEPAPPDEVTTGVDDGEAND
jgi:hypothetical protein